MWSFYNLGVRVLGIGLAGLSLFKPKVAAWKNGRKHQQISSHDNPIWIHCASLGEYLQAKPLIKLLHDDKKEVVLSFFSPSGFSNVTENTTKYYLPLDTYTNAAHFINKTNPRLAIFVRSEYWFNHLRVLNENQIPVVILNCLLNQEYYFFKPYGKWFLNRIKKIDWFYSSDITTKQMLHLHNINQCLHSGDTKVDQVAQSPKKENGSFDFNQTKKIILAGSVERDDRPIVKRLIETYAKDFLIIIVPHEPNENAFEYYQSITETSLKKYSESDFQDSNVIYVDIHGILPSLYSLSWVAYIGGGFGKGVHNILEACAVDCPMIIGPNHQKFPEAKNLLELSVAYEISNQIEINPAVEYFKNESNYRNAQSACKLYINQNKGATVKVFAHLKQKGFI